VPVYHVGWREEIKRQTDEHPLDAPKLINQQHRKTEKYTMKFAKNLGTLTVMAAAILATQAASAQSAWSDAAFINPDWADHASYIGASVGKSRAFIDNTQVSNRVLGPKTITTDNKDTGYKIIAGKQFSRNFAAEISYFDFGKFHYDTAGANGTLNREVGIRGGALDLIGIMPMSQRVSLYGKVGAQVAMAKEHFGGSRASAMGTNLDPRRKEVNLKAGVGVEYKFTEALATRFEIERYRLKDGLQQRADLNFASVSLIYKLGRPVAQAVVYTPPPVVEQPAPAPVVQTPPPPPPPPAPVPVSEKVSFAAETLFDFDKAIVKPAGKAALDDLLMKLQGMNTEAMITVGHTDAIGTDAYNQKLSLRRANAVKAYLISKGVEASRVYVEGKGEKQPVADNKTSAGRAQNRRVTVEVVGTRTPK
jgi:OOP family OmpA-OmpF porin